MAEAAEAPEERRAPTVSVSIPQADVERDSKERKPYVVFEIHFQVGEAEHVVRRRYSQLRKMHDQLQREAQLMRQQAFPFNSGLLLQDPHAGQSFGAGPRIQISFGAGGHQPMRTHAHALPPFPNASLFKDYCKPEHKEARRNELVGYLNCLVKNPALLKMPLFHELFSFEGKLVEDLIAAADHMAGGTRQSPQQQPQMLNLAALLGGAQTVPGAPSGHPHQQQPQMMNLGALLQGAMASAQQPPRLPDTYDPEQMQADYELAQSVLERSQAIEVEGSQMRTPVPLIYDHKITFTARVTDSQFEDHLVTGPGGEPWFEVKRLNRVILSFDPHEFGVFNMRGEQLAYFVQSNGGPNPNCSFYQVMSPVSDAEEKPLKVVDWGTIARSALTINDVAKHEIQTVSGPVGYDSRPPQNFFTVGGQLAARSDRGHVLINHYGNLFLEVEAGHDVLLYLTLAICVEKMHAKYKRQSAAHRRF